MNNFLAGRLQPTGHAFSTANPGYHTEHWHGHTPSHNIASVSSIGAEGSGKPFINKLAKMLSDPNSRTIIEIIKEGGRDGFRIIDIDDFQSPGGVLRTHFGNSNLATFEHNLRAYYKKEGRTTQTRRDAVWLRVPRELRSGSLTRKSSACMDNSLINTRPEPTGLPNPPLMMSHPPGPPHVDERGANTGCSSQVCTHIVQLIAEMRELRRCVEKCLGEQLSSRATHDRYGRDRFAEQMAQEDVGAAAFFLPGGFLGHSDGLRPKFNGTELPVSSGGAIQGAEVSTVYPGNLSPNFSLLNQHGHLEFPQARTERDSVADHDETLPCTLGPLSDAFTGTTSFESPGEIYCSPAPSRGPTSRLPWPGPIVATSPFGARRTNRAVIPFFAQETPLSNQRIIPDPYIPDEDRSYSGAAHSQDIPVYPSQQYQP